MILKRTILNKKKTAFDAKYLQKYVFKPKVYSSKSKHL